MITAVIIEDEMNSRELLQQMLENFYSDVQLLGLADDVRLGIELIKKTQPDVVFLDVEMPGGTGFDVLDAFEKPMFKVVFVTGYDHYAIKAIKYSAIDYLLKPISLKVLGQAIDRLKEIKLPAEDQLVFLKNNALKADQNFRQILLSNNKSYVTVNLEEIIYLRAEGSFVTFVIENMQNCYANKSLGFYEDLLPKAYFYRVHKSYIVNCHKVLEIETGRGGSLLLKNQEKLPVAVRRKPEFIRFYQDFI